MNTAATAQSVRLAEPAPVPTGHIGRVVAASLVGSALLAAVLAVLVVGGSSEPVVAGSVRRVALTVDSVKPLLIEGPARAR